MFVCVCVYVWMHSCMYSMYVSIYVYMCVCMYVCMYLLSTYICMYFMKLCQDMDYIIFFHFSMFSLPPYQCYNWQQLNINQGMNYAMLWFSQLISLKLFYVHNKWWISNLGASSCVVVVACKGWCIWLTYFSYHRVRFELLHNAFICHSHGFVDILNRTEWTCESSYYSLVFLLSYLSRSFFAYLNKFTDVWRSQDQVDIKRARSRIVVIYDVDLNHLKRQNKKWWIILKQRFRTGV